MSYTYHGTTDLVALPNRTVQTYPSGLVRVERSFVCRKAQVARFRNTIKVNEPMPFDDGAPAIDGLYIFPEPQELVRDDGFVEFRVTAYGRTNVFSEIAIQKGSIRGSYFASENPAPWFQPPPSFSEGDRPSINETYTLRGVLPSSEGAAAITIKPSIATPIVIPFSGAIGWSKSTPTRVSPPLIAGDFFRGSFTSSGTFGTISYDLYTITLLDILLDSFSSTNFGQWSEYFVTWVAGAKVFNDYRITSST
jgi:hypothetical protein